MGDYLSTPDKTKHSEEGSNSRISYGATTMQGWRRSQEDAHIANLDIGDGNCLFAVFDGHGGDQVAKFAEIHLVKELKELQSYKDKDYKKSLEEVFLKIDEIMLQQIRTRGSTTRNYDDEGSVDPSDYTESGCTSNVILVTKDKLYCANAGDSRAVMSNSGSAVELSHDHKPDNIEEKQRIERADGFVQMGRTNGVISLSRALGDFDYKKKSDFPPEQQAITAFPDVSEHDLNENVRFIVQACDGIWDCLTSEEAIAKFGDMLTQGKLTEKEIVESVLDEICATDTMNGVGCDNMTCILINFKK